MFMPPISGGIELIKGKSKASSANTTAVFFKLFFLCNSNKSSAAYLT